jgi:hypothetical protein
VRSSARSDSANDVDPAIPLPLGEGQGEGVARGGAPKTTTDSDRAALLARLDGADTALALLPADDAAGASLPTIPADDPVLAPWHAAGARAVVPLRATRDGALLGAWLLGVRRTGELFDREDLAALDRVAGQAALLLDYDRMARQRAAEREALLRRQIEDLRVEIDTARREREAHEITDSEHFRELRRRAAELRRSRATTPADS